MATLARQPFAPLDRARLQTLTSIKNRQNATPPAASKRKASELVDDDSENVNPSLFAKRAKGSDTFSFAKGSDLFPSLTQDALKPSLLTKPRSASTTPRPRPRPKSPVSKLNTSVPRPPLSAPAGRSPTRGKRSGILSRRKTSGLGRVDPPSFNAAPAVPFSLDAALKGTIPSYASRAETTSTSTPTPSDEATPFLSTPEMKPSWFFDIHEDTPDQEMTNLLQHSTCVLDISSDEESTARARDDRGKENVPPADDVSQTSGRRSAAAARRGAEEMVVEKERAALKEMDAGAFYAEGCDATSVFVVPADEEEIPKEGKKPAAGALEPERAEVAAKGGPEKTESVESLLERREPAPAAVLEPMEGTGESFELWESGSAKGEDAPSPAPAEA